MIDTVDDVGMRREQGVGFYLFEGAGDGFLAEWTTDFLECVELRGRRFLNEVDVGKAALDIRSKNSWTVGRREID